MTRNSVLAPYNENVSNIVPRRASSVRELIERCRPTEPLYCLYPKRIEAAARDFLDGFPGTTLYAVKANPHPDVIKTLAGAGVHHFDTASLREIQLVKELVPNATCYFMAICKLVGAAERAFLDYGVRHFVADHLSEVERLAPLASPDTTIHVRLKAFDPASVYELSSKFGADPDNASTLLRRVAEMGCRPGLAFNVGSLCTSAEAYRSAISNAVDVARNAGVDIVSLDVGGGFPIAYPDIAADEIQTFFRVIHTEASSAGLPVSCQLMCEPGRALVARGQSLLTQVILVKEDLVFVNDGVYGALRELELSKGAIRFPIEVYRLNGAPSDRSHRYRVSGPTCDSFDILPGTTDLPEDIRVGDWIEFGLSGAYSNAMASRFNGLYADRWVRIREGK